MIEGMVSISEAGETPTKYKWMEISSGTSRGIRFNPGEHIYRISPNPHDDRYYNKNHLKWYTGLAGEVARKVQAEGWTEKIKDCIVNGISYELSQ